MTAVTEAIRDLIERGGPVMWPLLALSLASVALIIERAVYWISAHRPGRAQWVLDVADRLRAGDEAGVRAIIARDRSIYARVVRSILAAPRHDDLAVDITERYRREVERFATSLSTIITAAPLLGILGTVTGIIRSFDLLGQTRHIADIESVASGIAEALITTAFGLVIALVALFPFMIYRAQSDRLMGAIDLLVASHQAATAKRD